MHQSSTNLSNKSKFLLRPLLALIFAAGMLCVLSVSVAFAATDCVTVTGPAVGIVADQVSLQVGCNQNNVSAAANIVGTGILTTNMHIQNTFTVPVSFSQNAANISSVEFVLDYDEACVTYDAITDSDNDGLPDAVDALPNTAGSLPAGFNVLTEFTSPSSIQMLVKPPTNNPPLPLLSDGGLITFTFGVVPSCLTNDGSPLSLTFTMTNAIFGNNLGQAVAGDSVVDRVDLRFNANPTDIILSNNAISETLPTGTLIGTLDSVDVDETAPRPGDSHTYSLVNGVLPNGNISFTISGAQLLTAIPLDFEAAQGYSVTIRSTDSYGGMYTETLTVVISDVNEAPTDILVSSLTISENLTTPATIATLDSVDVDEIDPGAPTDIIESHTYLLPSGEVDNADFVIAGNVLSATTTFNYEVKNSYNVMIRTTDSGGNMYTKTVTILVLNANDAPVGVDDPDSTPIIVTGSSTTAINVLANDTDQDGNLLSVSAVDAAGTAIDGAAGAIVNNTTNVSYTAANVNGMDSFSYTVADNGSPVLTDTAMVTVNVVENDARGDCNSDGNINAADFPALVLEIFDTDETYLGNPAWWRIFKLGFAGSPRGCDANATRNGVGGTAASVQASDIICTVLVFFGNNACTIETVASANAHDTASLAVGTGLTAKRGESVSVPVNLVSAGNKVAAAAFALDFDAANFSFDATDADSNGIPDAVTFNVPASMVKSVTYNAAQSRVEIAVYSASIPLKLLSDGAVATVKLTVQQDISIMEAPVALAVPSLGNDQGQDVALETSNGVVQVPDAGTRQVFLPMITR